MITIFLVDDHPLVRLGLRAALQTESDFLVVGETGDGLDALHLVETLKPEVLVVDIWLQGLNGIEVIRRVTEPSSGNRPAVVVLSMSSSENLVLGALKSGALGYVLKDSPVEHLFRAIRAAIAGRRYLGPPISDTFVEFLVQQARSEAVDSYDTLTGREREVLHLVVNGYSNNKIASRLSLGKRTVDTYRANILRKLGVRNNPELIRYAIKRGILPLDG